MSKAAGQDSALRSRQPPLAERLRLAREATGASVDAAGRAARIPVRYVRMLEEGHYPLVSDPAYLVSFLRRYARHLGLDVERVAREFIEHADTEAAREGNMTPDARKNGAGPSAQRGRGGSFAGWLVFGSVIVAVGLIAGYGAWTWMSTSAVAEISMVEPPAPVLDDPRVEPPSAAAEAPSVAPAGEPAAPSAVAPSEMASRSAMEAKPAAPVPVPAAPAAQPDPPLANRPTGSSVAGLLPPFELEITILARQVWVWISVDGGPRRALSLMAGQTMTWTAQRNYVLSVDDAAGIRATLNGTPIRSLGTGVKRNLVIPSPDLTPPRHG